MLRFLRVWLPPVTARARAYPFVALRLRAGRLVTYRVSNSRFPGQSQDPKPPLGWAGGLEAAAEDLHHHVQVGAHLGQPPQSEGVSWCPVDRRPAAGSRFVG